MKLTSLFLCAPLAALVIACSAAPTSTSETETTTHADQALSLGGDGPSFPNPCEGHICPDGQHCSAPADAPICVADETPDADPPIPDFPRDPCHKFHCPTGYQCQAPADAPKCVPVHPTPNPCATVLCAFPKRCYAVGRRAVCR